MRIENYDMIYMLGNITKEVEVKSSEEKERRTFTKGVCKYLSAAGIDKTFSSDILTFFADFKIPLPSALLNWFASIGVKHYLSVLRKAVAEYKEIQKQKKEKEKDTSS